MARPEVKPAIAKKQVGAKKKEKQTPTNVGKEAPKKAEQNPPKPPPRQETLGKMDDECKIIAEKKAQSLIPYRVRANASKKDIRYSFFEPGPKKRQEMVSPFCNYRDQRAQTYAEHLNQVVCEKKPVGARDQTSGRLRSHNCYICELCLRPHDDWDKLLKHTWSEHLVTSRHCYWCCRDFTTFRRYRRHVSNRHLIIRTCQACMFEAGSQLALQVHQRYEHPELPTGDDFCEVGKSMRMISPVPFPCPHSRIPLAPPRERKELSVESEN